MFKNQFAVGLALAALAALASAPAAADQSACTLPGIVMADDAAGDADNSPVSTASVPNPLPTDDILQVSVAEPGNLSNRLVFTIKVAGLPALPPAYRWVAYFTLPDSGGNDVLWYAAMTTADVAGGATPAAPKFEYGKAGATDTPAVSAGTFEKAGDLDAASAFNADGTITLVLDTTAAGAKPGDTLYGVYAKVRRSVPNEAMNIGLTIDTTDDQPNDYTVVGNAACAKDEEGKGISPLAGALPLPALLLLGLFGAARRFSRRI